MKRVIFTTLFCCANLWAAPLALVAKSQGSGASCKDLVSGKTFPIGMGDLIPENCQLTTDSLSALQIRYVDGMAEVAIQPASILELSANNTEAGLRKQVRVLAGSCIFSTPAGGGMLVVDAGTFRASLNAQQTLHVKSIGPNQLRLEGSTMIQVVNLTNGTTVSLPIGNTP
jgi:hypothetical protein